MSSTPQAHQQVHWSLVAAALAVLLTALCVASPICAASADKPVIVIIGATGQQGGAVLREVLRSGHYVARAVTRSPDKPAARTLTSAGAQLVKADLEQPASLDLALAGAYGVFGVTDYWEHGAEGEIRQGMNLINAAARARVKHLVFSSVASSDRNTGIPHFESKRRVEFYLEKSEVPYTILRPVAFMENWNNAARDLSGGELRDALQATTKLQHISVEDIGRFAREAFDHPQQWIGRELDVAGDQMTMPQVAAAFTRVLGHQVVYRKISWAELRLRYGAENEAMTHWFDTAGYDVDIGGLRREFPWLRTFDEYLQGRNWNSQIEHR